MRAAVFERYGGPEVVRVVEVARPVARAGEVLVRVSRKVGSIVVRLPSPSSLAETESQQ
ncbi:hypothetical protein [Streptomyces sp. CC219B]|uniref:hypothetical protein n=1 Tax=Streptomyces sp. CC219B TaxID=3044574 RepID=UPI0024A9E4FE|nr:hypothetical protein [Streptomyces sp. CC219B]